MYKVFIDGQHGTTGLRIYERFAQREDIEVLAINESERKDVNARLKKIEESDVTFLCLPDAASKEVAAAAKDTDTIIIDASTAFRCDDNWAYGLPELGPEYLAGVKNNKRIANPGCHATGSITVIAPLVKSGLIPADYPITITSLTGYSGGGKQMIADYENPHDKELDAPRIYALGQAHKHLAEIVKHCKLQAAPIFLPIVAPYYAGMLVTVGFINKTGKILEDVHTIFSEFYKNQKFVQVAPLNETPKMLGSNNLFGKDYLKIYICGNDERITVSSQFDNLGKGASGAAIESMNIALGLDPAKGLDF
jgi:N-acetyl-gamma-glutamyl-phosphate reductase